MLLRRGWLARGLGRSYLRWCHHALLPGGPARRTRMARVLVVMALASLVGNATLDQRLAHSRARRRRRWRLQPRSRLRGISAWIGGELLGSDGHGVPVVVRRVERCREQRLRPVGLLTGLGHQVAEG